ncbi:hypothetical protein MA16_Dca010681 [Dendrobium catenatum]|uniref:Uncharacterized protein n=1 Tax=Dendrobium catenatum TaxID=906689 RepID=A0A2I0VK69_9ASPA|nr:hypothetical protein MA16_Dca010681 [Dendrobium catenatum]
MSSILLLIFLILSLSIYHGSHGRHLNSIRSNEMKTISSPHSIKETGLKMKQEKKNLVAYSVGSKMASKNDRFPRIRHRDQSPGFNIDYAGPKTHPPSHN